MTSITATIGEINIICSDVARSLRFYRDILGFNVESEEEGYWHLSCGGVRFLLLPFAAPRPELPPYCSEPTYSIDIVVSDLEAAMTYMQSHGVTIMNDPPPNDRRFFIRDPDGLPLEVVAGTTTH
jgi:catechol 2,3-dioxygenase-like lactoylglutathione lyase family enzyme